ncbi:MAG: VCBS repeat-containing protein [Myxococcales bacterium]|nr:VCBS repeat-containing protein [Myxococcales bacterium]MCB9707542.1 VCBS repeat-containing protein [Myxococcales bacterium]
MRQLTARMGAGLKSALVMVILGLWGCADSHLLTLIEIEAPQDGAALNVSDDQDTDAEGFQFKVQVNTSGLDEGVELVLEHGTGETPAETDLSTQVGKDGSATFPLYTFVEGDNVIRVHVKDDAETASSVHHFTVGENALDVSIDTPSDGAALNADTDCSTTDAGYQLQIVASTTAEDGSMAQAWVGTDPDADTPTGNALVEDGKAEFCLNADEGQDIPITVRVTRGEGADAISGTDAVSVTIDLVAPLNAITDLTVSYFLDPTDAAQRRSGEVTFTWTAVSGGGTGAFSDLDHYVVRCAQSAIITDADWDAAETSEVTLTSEPQTEGNPETEVISGFQRLGVNQHCALRGADSGGSLTPLNSPTASVLVTNPFAEHTIIAPLNLGSRPTAVGDVNGDGMHDMLLNASGAAYLYYGIDSATTAFSPGPDVTFVSTASTLFSSAAVGIGDFNGDGRDDFAIADSNEGAPLYYGAVYIVYGRSDADGPAPWATGDTVDVSSGGGCSADVCIRGASAGLLLGANIGAAGDFDNDGKDDVAITALGAGGFAGQVYILLGREESELPSGQLIELPVQSGGFDVEGFTIEGAANFKQLGTAIAGLGDSDDDGRADIALGASGIDNSNGLNPADDLPGEVRFVAGTDYGTSTGLISLGNGVLVMEDVPGASAASPGFASWLANVGNFNGEGGSELAIFAPGWMDDDGTPGLSAGDTVVNDGKVIMLLGNGAFSNVTPFVTFSNDFDDKENDLFGNRIATAWHPTLTEAGFLLTDLDADGFSDLVLDSVETGTGPAGSYIFYGHANATDRVRSTADVNLPGYFTSPNHTRAVGDINTDGYPDLVLVDNGVAHVLY